MQRHNASEKRYAVAFGFLGKFVTVGLNAEGCLSHVNISSLQWRSFESCRPAESFV